MCVICKTDREPYIFHENKPFVNGNDICETIYPCVRKKSNQISGKIVYEVTISKKGSHFFDSEECAIEFAKSMGIEPHISLARIFSDATFDYTGERPCKRCCRVNMYSYKKHGIDYIIINKLFNVATKGRRKEVLTQSSILSGKAQITTTKSIDKNIRLALVNGKPTFRVVFKIKEIHQSATFDNLTEAIKHRDSIEKTKVRRIKGKVVRETVEKNIYRTINSETKCVSYLVRVSTTEKKVTSKSFSTLKEAQDHKAIMLSVQKNDAIETKAKRQKSYQMRIEKNIYKTVNTYSDKIHFTVKKIKDKKRKQISFKTLQEARNFLKH